MIEDRLPEIGGTISIEKAVLDSLLVRLKERGYELIGPRAKNGTLVYDPIESMEQLPRGYVSEQEAGSFRLTYTGHSRYFDVIPGAPSWKQFLFPPRLDLFNVRKNGQKWELQRGEPDAHAYAFVGVRACELAAIQTQDRAFIREDFVDPLYRRRREHVFILAVNCLHPAGTCFCASMETGPRVRDGFDLCLTELDDVFLLTIGSELARGILAGVPFEAASAFLLNNAERAIQQASGGMGRRLDTSDLPDLILDNLDHAEWQDVAARCLSCSNCTQVCPTCFCWDAVDQTNLSGQETLRTRVWDSCFNPDYSYQAGGNTRPTIRSRYRQWLSHKLGSWKQQYGVLGCVGCGRCITWCPARIDLTQEVAALRKETT
jgi:sulfhydrogenase subunit beta (sulfur reductase)